MRPNEIAICDALMMVYAGVEIDSGLLRLVGKGDVSSRAKGSEETGANGEKLKKTAVALGNRIGEVSDCLKLVWQRLAAI